MMPRIRLKTYAWVLLLAIGCNRSDVRSEPVYPVDGQLFVGGRPADGAIVTFQLQDAPSQPSELSVVVRDGGHFVPIQSDGGIGLPAGTYGLTVRWPESGRDRFGGKYDDASKPVKLITVNTGVNLIPRIDLP